MLAAMWLALAGCATKVGEPCDNDADCGSGFDCYRNACVRVCTKAEQCDPGQQCLRYHCLLGDGSIPGAATRPQTPPRPSGPNVSTGPMPPGGQVALPAPAGTTPSASAAELRAIRRELEIVREQQTKILELLEGKGKKK